MRGVLTIVLALQVWLLCAQPGHKAAKPSYTRADTLRGALRAERTCYDVGHYDLTVWFDLANKAIRGVNVMTYRVTNDFDRLQVDLFANMVLDSVVFEGASLHFARIDNAVFVRFPAVQRRGDTGRLALYYHGKPVVARNPPWDGGVTWTHDPKGRAWVVVNCEGIGASLWWPNKDHLSDEPDSADIRLVVPDSLVAVSNGYLLSVEPAGDGMATYHWHVSYPINNYNITFYLGDYAHLHDTYVAGDGDKLSLDYYVLRENADRAREHFRQVKQVLRIYEDYLGKYPFWRDGYALVESPALGMEHQSAISYGNRFMKGYLGGRLLPGMDWDYIIVHESAHEYWGNSVSCTDLAEMWLHEAFATYMEALYVEARYGKDVAIEYLRSQRKWIRNNEPIEGPMGVNYAPMSSTDQYYKGSWFLHSLRHTIGSDTVWFGLLRAYYQRYALKTVTTQDFIRFVNHYTGRDLTRVIRQYVYHAAPPRFVYKIRAVRQGVVIKYKWDADEPGFDMPMEVYWGDRRWRLHPTGQWQTLRLTGAGVDDFRVADDHFYVRVVSK